MSGCEVDFDDLRKKCREFPRGVTISSDGYDSRMLNRHEDEGMDVNLSEDNIIEGTPQSAKKSRALRRRNGKDTTKPMARITRNMVKSSVCYADVPEGGPANQNEEMDDQRSVDALIIAANKFMAENKRTVITPHSDPASEKSSDDVSVYELINRANKFMAENQRKYVVPQADSANLNADVSEISEEASMKHAVESVEPQLLRKRLSVGIVDMDEEPPQKKARKWIESHFGTQTPLGVDYNIEDFTQSSPSSLNGGVDYNIEDFTQSSPSSLNGGAFEIFGNISNLIHGRSRSSGQSSFDDPMEEITQSFYERDEELYHSESPNFNVTTPVSNFVQLPEPEFSVVLPTQARQENAEKHPNSDVQLNVEHVNDVVDMTDVTVSQSPSADKNNREQDLQSNRLSDFANVIRNQPMVRLQKIHMEETMPPLVFVQPGRPAMIQGNGMLTRAMAMNNYNDADEGENELIGMERAWLNSSRVALAGRPMPKQKKFELFSKQCQFSKLPAPVPFDKFEALDWDYVEKCDETQLMPGYSFKTSEELKLIPRRHPKFPFCHPGPVRDEDMQIGSWYYADTIVDEVKFVGISDTFYSVRWIGYEDEYNTVERERNLAGTAILTLYKRRHYATAARSNGPVLLRRSIRRMDAIVSPVPVIATVPSQNRHCARAMKLLNDHLLVEETADRYSTHIGFHASDGNVVTAVNYQFDFIRAVFLPLVNSIGLPNFHMSEHFLGSLFGNRRDKRFKNVNTTTIYDKDSIGRYIRDGLKVAESSGETSEVVSFFVFAKHGSSDSGDEKHLDMHVCVYTVKRQDGKKDCVYYDPSPECKKHSVPTCVRDFRESMIRSSTRSFGKESQLEDCMFQCFKYVIQLHTGQIQLQTDLKLKHFPRV